MPGPLFREKTLEAFRELDLRLKRPLKLLVGGGAAMTLAYGMPEGTQDVDAVTFKGFDKIEDIKEEIQAVGRKLQIDPDWINPYFSNFAIVLPPDYTERLRTVFEGKNLSALALGPEDLFIMKLHAGRPKDDAHIRRLLKTQKMDLELVEEHLQNLFEKGLPKAEQALERFDQYLDELEIEP